MRILKKISVLFIVLIVLFNISAFGQTLNVGEISAKPGERTDGFIIVPEGSDGDEVKIPVTVINGTKKGPVLALTAAIHGYEYPPVIAFQRLIKIIDPKQVSGALIFVHVANIPSFLKRTIYYGPHDWKNLNRVFPGKIDGTMSERIAFQITKEVIDKCDYLIDNHCGDGNEDLMPYLYCLQTGDASIDKATKMMAENYGLPLAINEKGRPTDIKESVYGGNTAIVRGKPAITIESGKLGRTDEIDIKRVVTGTLNVMKVLNMIKGEPQIDAKPVWVQKYTIIRSEKTGIFYPLVSRADHVQKGQLIGYLTDFFGNRIQEARAPYDGIVLYIVATPPMSPGEPMASIGQF